ncbi:MAG: winged helix-turn-helix transcriptional regulator [Actinotalea sp.]|nr:winged helix-turn-helix transcriptional regulator [Actinotalea sp.]
MSSAERSPGPGPGHGPGHPGAGERVEDLPSEADARALGSVLRMRILRMCLDEALTNKEIARRLGKDPGTTYHHVRTLADRGFLAAQAERRGARGAREVPYLATRKSWRAPDVPGQHQVLVDAFLEELAEAPPSSVVAARLGVRLSPAAWEQALGRIADVLQELADLPPESDGVPYSLFFAAHEDAARRRTESPPPP